MLSGSDRYFFNSYQFVFTSLERSTDRSYLYYDLEKRNEVLFIILNSFRIENNTLSVVGHAAHKNRRRARRVIAVSFNRALAGTWMDRDPSEAQQISVCTHRTCSHLHGSRPVTRHGCSQL